jgi:hypothetical protein
MTPATQSTTARSSFLKGLLNFDEFITARLVKIVYVVGLVLIPLITIGGGVLVALSSLYALYSVYELLHYSFATVLVQLFLIILQLVVSVVVCVLGILLLRLYCEFVMVIFKINENLQVLRNRNAQI